MKGLWVLVGEHKKEKWTAPEDKLIILEIWKGQCRSSVELISKLSSDNLRNDCCRSDLTNRHRCSSYFSWRCYALLYKSSHCRCKTLDMQELTLCCWMVMTDWALQEVIPKQNWSKKQKKKEQFFCLFSNGRVEKLPLQIVQCRGSEAWLVINLQAERAGLCLRPLIQGQGSETSAPSVILWAWELGLGQVIFIYYLSHALLKSSRPQSQNREWESERESERANKNGSIDLIRPFSSLHPGQIFAVWWLFGLWWGIFWWFIAEQRRSNFTWSLCVLIWDGGR